MLFFPELRGVTSCSCFLVADWYFRRRRGTDHELVQYIAETSLTALVLHCDIDEKGTGHCSILCSRLYHETMQEPLQLLL